LYYSTNLALFDDLGTCQEPSQFEFTSTAPAVLTTAQLALAVWTAVANFMESLSTTQLGFQRTIGTKDTYVPGTVLERLYKRVGKALDLDDGAFVLTPDDFAPTLDEVAAVQAEVDDEALTRAIESVKSTVRSSDRHWVDSKKVLLNKAAQLDKAVESE
jgi:hypothetical protein